MSHLKQLSRPVEAVTGHCNNGMVPTRNNIMASMREFASKYDPTKWEIIDGVDTIPKKRVFAVLKVMTLG